MQEQSNLAIKESLPESDPLLRSEELNLLTFDSDTDQANERAFGAIASFYVISEQERQDMEMDTSAKGWPKYWMRRLAGEIDILPNEIGETVKKLNAKMNPKENQRTSLAEYVNRRVEILKFQVLKREEMAKLKDMLGRIDSKRIGEGKNTRTVSYDESTRKMTVMENDAPCEISWGDIVADGEWGIKYQPDRSMPENVWRKMRKLIAVKETRRNIENIYNKELSAVECVPIATSSWDVNFFEKQLKKDPHISGAIAERMAQNFLIRLGYDNQSFMLRVEHSNTLEDAVLKYDFKVVLPEKMRGVTIEGDELSREEYIKSKRKLGIQFTTISNPNKLHQKEIQVDKAKIEISDEKYNRFIKKQVDDIVLVSLPFGTYKTYFEKWLAEGKPSGGPEQYFTKEEKVALIKKVTENALDLTDKEIEELVL